MNDELWDLYDSAGEPLDRTIRRGEPMAEGEFHLVVQIWVRNPRGEYLIQKRADHLEILPGLWAATAGSVLAGEDSRTGAAEVDSNDDPWRPVSRLR